MSIDESPVAIPGVIGFWVIGCWPELEPACRQRSILAGTRILDTRYRYPTTRAPFPQLIPSQNASIRFRMEASGNEPRAAL